MPAMAEPVSAAYPTLPATETEAIHSSPPSPAAAMASSVPSSSATMVETRPTSPLPATATEEIISSSAEVETGTTPPVPLAETAETTPPPPWSVNTADTETQTEREEGESPERKRKKTTRRATEAEILLNFTGDPNDASLEISDNEDEDNEVCDISGVPACSFDGQDAPAKRAGIPVLQPSSAIHASSAEVAESVATLKDLPKILQMFKNEVDALCTK